MIPRIKKLEALDDYVLYVVFDDGKIVEYDVKEDMDTIDSYKELREVYGLFKQVNLDQSRTCVYWNTQGGHVIYPFRMLKKCTLNKIESIFL